VVNLNAEDYVGDGPIVETTLIYRPVDGMWDGEWITAARTLTDAIFKSEFNLLKILQTNNN